MFEKHPSVACRLPLSTLSVYMPYNISHVVSSVEHLSKGKDTVNSLETEEEEGRRQTSEVPHPVVNETADQTSCVKNKTSISADGEAFSEYVAPPKETLSLLEKPSSSVSSKLIFETVLRIFKTLNLFQYIVPEWSEYTGGTGISNLMYHRLSIQSSPSLAYLFSYYAAIEEFYSCVSGTFQNMAFFYQGGNVTTNYARNTSMAKPDGSETPRKTFLGMSLRLIKRKLADTLVFLDMVRSQNLFKTVPQLSYSSSDSTAISPDVVLPIFSCFKKNCISSDPVTESVKESDLVLQEIEQNHLLSKGNNCLNVIGQRTNPSATEKHYRPMDYKFLLSSMNLEKLINGANDDENLHASKNINQEYPIWRPTSQVIDTCSSAASNYAAGATAVSSVDFSAAATRNTEDDKEVNQVSEELTASQTTNVEASTDACSVICADFCDIFVHLLDVIHSLLDDSSTGVDDRNPRDCDMYNTQREDPRRGIKPVKNLEAFNTQTVQSEENHSCPAPQKMNYLDYDDTPCEETQNAVELPQYCSSSCVSVYPKHSSSTLTPRKTRTARRRRFPYYRHLSVSTDEHPREVDETRRVTASKDHWYYDHAYQHEQSSKRSAVVDPSWHPSDHLNANPLGVSPARYVNKSERQSSVVMTSPSYSYRVTPPRKWKTDGPVPQSQSLFETGKQEFLPCSESYTDSSLSPDSEKVHSAASSPRLSQLTSDTFHGYSGKDGRKKVEKKSKGIKLRREKKKILTAQSFNTPCQGVCWDPTHQRWVAHWSDSKTHQRIRKYFNPKILGFQKARLRAILTRKEAVDSGHASMMIRSEKLFRPSYSLYSTDSYEPPNSSTPEPRHHLPSSLYDERNTDHPSENHKRQKMQSLSSALPSILSPCNIHDDDQQDKPRKRNWSYDEKKRHTSENVGTPLEVAPDYIPGVYWDEDANVYYAHWKTNDSPHIQIKDFPVSFFLLHTQNDFSQAKKLAQDAAQRHREACLFKVNQTKNSNEPQETLQRPEAQTSLVSTYPKSESSPSSNDSSLSFKNKIMV